MPDTRSADTDPRLDGLVFDERGLLPVVVQEAATRDVLMLAWGTRTPSATPRMGAPRTGRGPGEIWVRARLRARAARRSVATDCDGTHCLCRRQTGAACHTDGDVLHGREPHELTPRASSPPRSTAVIPVHTTVLADTETPLSCTAAWRRASAVSSWNLRRRTSGAATAVGRAPVATLTESTARPSGWAPPSGLPTEGTRTRLEAAARAGDRPTDDGLPPMVSSFVGYLGWERSAG